MGIPSKTGKSMHVRVYVVHCQQSYKYWLSLTLLSLKFSFVFRIDIQEFRTFALSLFDIDRQHSRYMYCIGFVRVYKKWAESWKLLWRVTMENWPSTAQ